MKRGDNHYKKIMAFSGIGNKLKKYHLASLLQKQRDDYQLYSQQSNICNVLRKDDEILSKYLSDNKYWVDYHERKNSISILKKHAESVFKAIEDYLKKQSTANNPYKIKSTTASHINFSKFNLQRVENKENNNNFSTSQRFLNMKKYGKTVSINILNSKLPLKMDSIREIKKGSVFNMDGNEDSHNELTESPIKTIASFQKSFHLLSNKIDNAFYDQKKFYSTVMPSLRKLEKGQESSYRILKKKISNE